MSPRDKIADLAAGLWDRPLLASTLRLASVALDCDPGFVVATLDRAIADNRSKKGAYESNGLLGQAREIAKHELNRRATA